MYSPYLWDMMAINTNLFANKNNLKKWENVNKKTMKGFMAVIFMMGLIKK